MSAPTTAVIGAGISGLTAGKMLDDYGVPYTCFEASDRVGGNWAFGNPNGHSSAYRSLHIDTSKHQLSFKDFPMPERLPGLPAPHPDQGLPRLLRRRLRPARAHRVRQRRRARRAARRAAAGRSPTRPATTRRFDLLVVANGHHWDPRTADFPGEFTGETIHSHHYVDPWTPLHLMDKRILVVGLGNSAADITVELSQRALRNEVTLSTRSSAWIVPKLVGRQGRGHELPHHPAAPAVAGSARSPSGASGSPTPTRRSTGCRLPTTSSSRRTRPSPASCRCG